MDLDLPRNKMILKFYTLFDIRLIIILTPYVEKAENLVSRHFSLQTEINLIFFPMVGDEIN